MTREEKAIEKIKMILKKVTADVENAVCYVTPYDADELDMAIKALKAMNQIYKITNGCAEALYQSETTFDGVANILTDYFKVVEENDERRAY